MIKRFLFAALALTASATPALAHLDPAAHGSIMAGISHPLFGPDHVLAMLAVGLWAASLRGRALFAVPAAFLGTMVLGFAAALYGLPLPLVEPTILASIIFIGIMVALALPIPSPAVAGMVAFFAFFHGHAHGGELGGAGAAEFAVGFILATAALHALGVFLGVRLTRATASGGLLTRLAGALTALGGAYIAFGG